MKALKYSLIIFITLLICLVFWQWQIDSEYKGLVKGPSEITIGSDCYVDIKVYAAFDQLDEIKVELQLPQNFEFIRLEKSLIGLSLWRYRVFFQAYEFTQIESIPVFITIGDQPVVKAQTQSIKVKQLLNNEKDLVSAGEIPLDDKQNDKQHSFASGSLTVLKHDYHLVNLQHPLPADQI
jgi:acetylglutamate synthase